MKLSSVWTASPIVLAILLAPGCVEHRMAKVQPLQPSIPPPSTNPAKSIPSPAPVTAAPANAAPAAVAPLSQPDNPNFRPSLSPRESALNASRPKPAVSKPAKPREIVVKDAPPPPQVEVVGTAPGNDYAWIPGAWQWRDRWVWTAGRWAVKPRSDAIWAKGHWVKREEGWVWVRGYWR